MFRGFELSVKEDFLSTYKGIGASQHQENKRLVDECLDRFRDGSGDLLAAKMTAEWFPEIDAQVFISHAHKDSALALSLAGHLHKELGLKSFVDSALWGYSDDLLRILDDAFCYNETSGTYSYAKRNRSTSHVHMMLSVALSRMIDRCECIIFINTPQSITSRDYIKGDKTDSPWIFSEIAMTRLINKRSREDHRGIEPVLATESLGADTRLRVRYDVDLGHLSKFDGATYGKWTIRSNGRAGATALDTLYDLVPPSPTE